MLTCRHCRSSLDKVFVDLGHQPPSNAYLQKESLLAPEITFPLKVYVCENCWLVQLPKHAPASELFTPNYAYFSSVSKSWLAHCEHYVGEVTERFGLGSQSFIVEVASNDGYLLQYVKSRGIPCLGIEPTASTAAAARSVGIETIEVFLGDETGREISRVRGKADLLIANNVFAHVPDINDFAKGVANLLGPEGVVTFEFPHLLRLVDGLQFDTIYHEHYSYLSFYSAQRVLAGAGLRVFDVEELPTHGGSLRLFACHNSALHEECASVSKVIDDEKYAGVTASRFYETLQAGAEKIKNDLLVFLINEKRAGRRVVGYGAAAKGNTLLNFAGVRSDLIPFVCDAAPSKQGQFLPGSHIPILSPSAIDETRPETIFILPWNIAKEVTDTMSRIHEWGGRFFVAVPRLTLS